MLVFVVANNSSQLYTKVGCDEVDMLEHTQELLKELGPSPEEVQVPGDDEAEDAGEGESGDSDCELLEESNENTENMEVS